MHLLVKGSACDQLSKREEFGVKTLKAKGRYSQSYRITLQNTKVQLNYDFKCKIQMFVSFRAFSGSA
jgi:hypothetical protein